MELERIIEQALEWLHGHIIPSLILTAVGLALGWLLGWWRRHRLLRQIIHGSARDMVAIEQMLVKDHEDGHTTMRIRSCGAAPLKTILTNPVAHDAFLRRSEATTPTNPLISMHDQMGSYLLYLLTPWVCGMVRRGHFPHDVWVMAPVCEASSLSAHQATTVLLVRREDLGRFLEWDRCKDMHVEHGSDGARLLTLWQMAREFEKQHAEVMRLKAAGQRSTFVETMYVLDLGLDTEEVALPTKPVPWERFTPVLKKLGLG
jgi:hypothetical protein